ncbi:LiaF transmembrane domain-containing protein [Halobaculum limi]|uniref:LiaF transmembrane domain-containing protein n=1 Tax=Halobaculum limi TaxID=3031916 RepID=UPI00240544BB|nr:hypothetical protein [Halobaculum sp. YSMS11]
MSQSTPKTTAEPSVESTSRTSRTSRVLGGIVVVLGLVLLADTTGLVAVDGFELFLAGALVVYGAYRLVSERARHLFWPGAFVLVGSGWLLVELGVVTAGQATGFWPLLLVLFGASLLRGRGRRSAFGSDAIVVATGVGGGANGVTAVFDDARLDLRGLELPDRATVEPVAIFGDAEVVVPDDRVVLIRSTSVFGTVRDMRRSHPTGEPDLVIDGTAIFGDVRITD